MDEKVTFGVIVSTRGFFPDRLAEEGRKIVLVSKFMWGVARVHRLCSTWHTPKRKFNSPPEAYPNPFHSVTCALDQCAGPWSRWPGAGNPRGRPASYTRKDAHPGDN